MMEAMAKELEPPPQGSTATKKWSVFSLGLRGLWMMRSGMRRNIDSMSSLLNALLEPSAETPIVLRTQQRVSPSAGVWSTKQTHSRISMAGSCSNNFLSKSTRFDDSQRGIVAILCLHSCAFSSFLQSSAIT
jgi:hypothetical protein